MRPITFICAYYRNAGMFAEQQRVWADYPDDVKPHFHAIVTDDVSPDESRLRSEMRQPTGVGSLQLFRNTGPKRRWNWLFARNLGVYHAPTDWVVVSDIDHVLPAETVRTLMTTDMDKSRVYRFARVDAPHPWPYALDTCPAYKPHPNTWCMTKAMYDRIGGYDERLSGCYGTDGEFRERVNQAAQAVVVLAQPVVRYPREIVPDASTHPDVMTRKNDRANDDDLRRRREARATIPGWRPLRITSPYEAIP